MSYGSSDPNTQSRGPGVKLSDFIARDGLHGNYGPSGPQLPNKTSLDDSFVQNPNDRSD